MSDEGEILTEREWPDDRKPCPHCGDALVMRCFSALLEDLRDEELVELTPEQLADAQSEDNEDGIVWSIRDISCEQCGCSWTDGRDNVIRLTNDGGGCNVG